MDLSARLDGEELALSELTVDEHIATCGACRSFESSLLDLRRSMRVRPAESMPDLTEQIMRRLPVRRIERSELRRHLRTTAVSAAATIALLWSSTWIGGGPPADTAQAASIARQIRRAARDLHGYSARFEVVERNWSSTVPVRHFEATVGFHPPERFELAVQDLSPETQGYIGQDYSLIAGANRWRSSVSDQPLISHVNRQPFDGTAFIPTDVILPLESVASAPGLERIGESVIGRRDAFGVRVPFVVAAPLVRSLDPFSLWRPFYPTDEVEVWLDAETWFPLRFTVRAAGSDDRALWAARSGLADSKGETILWVTVRGAISSYGATDASLPEASGPSTDGGFRPSPRFEAVPGGPTDLAGLAPYRSGATVSGERVASYSAGLAWLKVARSRSRAVPLIELIAGEEVAVNGGTVYYTPAGPSHLRRVDLHEGRTHIRLESNLSRAELLTIAGSSPLVGRTVGAEGSGTRRSSIEAIGRYAFARIPSVLPEGYRVSGVFVTERGERDPSLSIYLRREEFETYATGILITETRDHVLPPTSEEPIVVRVGEVNARWSVERGELEFLVGNTYISILVPSFDLDTAIANARLQ